MAKKLQQQKQKQKEQEVRGSIISRVNLPGTHLYEDGNVDREEYVRLVIQTLRDVGYIESAATLEAESGYSLETPSVSQFRQYVLEAAWDRAEACLIGLGVTDEDSLWDARVLIAQQKYLEYLEAQRTQEALQVLRNELAHMSIDTEHLHTLSSLIMSSDPEDVRQRANWDGASGSSRHRLLANLQRYIPTSTMVPSRRMSTLLEQARSYQITQCTYHNSPLARTPFSLYDDHSCDKSAFPRVTTMILQQHIDEVWNIEWSHDGVYLASASKDRTAVIWRVDHNNSTVVHVLRDHPHEVNCLAWSLDDATLLTSAEHLIKSWNTKTGISLRTLNGHEETVTALRWLYDGSGFISAGLDRKMIIWDLEGNQVFAWGETSLRITDLSLTPDHSRLVAVGMYRPLPQVDMDKNTARAGHVSGTPGVGMDIGDGGQAMIIYDLASKVVEETIQLNSEQLSSVQVSQNSQFALVNHSPNEVQLWDLKQARITRKFIGLQQKEQVIRSCFGGMDDTFVVSGSEDGKVYVWHLDTGALIEVLTGHGEGSVSAVAWNPRNKSMFASCSDDNTIRIWESVDSRMTGTGTKGSTAAAALNGYGSGSLESVMEVAGDGDGKSSRKGKGKTDSFHWGDGAGAVF